MNDPMIDENNVFLDCKQLSHKDSSIKSFLASLFPFIISCITVMFNSCLGDVLDTSFHVWNWPRQEEHLGEHLGVSSLFLVV